MRIVRVRQISQAFFLVLFLWLCVVATSGEAWWQLRGWPVNLFLQLDPLIAVVTVIATGTLYAGLLWALLTVVLTLLLGRFFCGWVCPFGALHHFFGFLGRFGKSRSKTVARNRYHRAQVLKYMILAFLLGAAGGDLFTSPPGMAAWDSFVVVGVFAFVVLALSFRDFTIETRIVWMAVVTALWFGTGWLFSGQGLLSASVQTGFLDPIPFLHRSVNLVVLPILDGGRNWISISQRFTAGGWIIGVFFLASILINLRIPRFYCRFLCPLGALFAVLGSNALWRIGWTREEGCTQCRACDACCEGACEPSHEIRIKECLLCMNCREACPEDLLGFQTRRSLAGEEEKTGLSRRGFVCSVLAGAAAVPMARMEGLLDTNWSSRAVRPPGALKEDAFLTRCIKCGQCMRICPTNVIHPAGLEAGVEGIWTPVLNFRIGTSGCQYNCAACGHVCPTAAIRAVSLDEKQGKKDFQKAGPIRLGTAFVDRGRCLPWAMDKPCIVCQENCPVSPKAIFTQEAFVTIRDGRFKIGDMDGLDMTLLGRKLIPGEVATGDYFVFFPGSNLDVRFRIVKNGENNLILSPDFSADQPINPEDPVDIQVRLKRPVVSIDKCIGCGICEHECPVSGKRAIRVSAENESRNKRHTLVPGK